MEYNCPICTTKMVGPSNQKGKVSYICIPCDKAFRVGEIHHFTLLNDGLINILSAEAIKEEMEKRNVIPVFQ